MPNLSTPTLAPPAPIEPLGSGPPLRMVLAILTLALMPFPLVLHGWGDPKLAYDYLTIVFPVDLAFAALLLASARVLVHRVRAHRVGVGTGLWAVLTVVMTIAWLVHPSIRGLHTVFELWGVVALAATVAEAVESPFADLVLGGFGAVAVLETAWSTAQLIHGAGLGLTRLGEDAHPLLPFSPTINAPMGSMVHPYVLAGLGLVAGAVLAWRGLSRARPLPWLIAAGVAIAPVGFTFSRAGLLGAALLVGAFALAIRRSATPQWCIAAVAALCLGIGIPAAAWHGGWLTRANQTTSASTEAALTTDRGALVHQAVTLIRNDPLTGVGPGLYVPALKKTGPERHGHAVLKPVHDLPLLVGAEGGVLALLVLVGMYLGVGWRALRAGAIPTALYLVYLPFSILDHFPYSFPQGLVITAVWLGVLDATTSRMRSPDPAGGGPP
jgi:hypothetical protein